MKAIVDLLRSIQRTCFQRKKLYVTELHFLKSLRPAIGLATDTDSGY